MRRKRHHPISAIVIGLELALLAGQLAYLAAVDWTAHGAGDVLRWTETAAIWATAARYLLPVVVAQAALIGVILSRELSKYYFFQAVVIAAYIAAGATETEPAIARTILQIAVIGELILFEPYPTNLCLSLGATVVAGGLSLAFVGGDTSTFAARLYRDGPFVLSGIALSLLGSVMTLHRERNVDLTHERDELAESVVALTRANSLYQDFAVNAGEKATENERQRITRDIHDTVGYALTNNMMLLEAAMDMVQENPLAVPGIIETARSNAEDGLRQVRQAMYRLREKQPAQQSWVHGILRLVRIFQQATGISVKCDLANLPANLPHDIQSALYHIVQEALVNSFRHGKATTVDIVFWREDSSVQVHISDNGSGATEYCEGIGIKGMRERVEATGGSLRVDGRSGGFRVSARLMTERAR